MKIGIIGGGAIGLFLASKLSLISGQPSNITIYTRTQSQADKINTYGITFMEENGSVQKNLVKGRVFNYNKVQDDIVIFALKQYHLLSVLNEMNLCENQTLLFVQNGLSHLSELHRFRDLNIYLAVVEHGVFKESETCVKHMGQGKLRLWRYEGNNKELEELLLNRDQLRFPVEFVENGMEMMHRKLYVNAVINPLTALFQVRNGALQENKHLNKLAKQVFEELQVVFHFEKDSVWENISSILMNTKNNQSSMAKDVALGKQTEIESILGYVILVAEEKGVNVPVIRFLYHSILALYRGASDD